MKAHMQRLARYNLWANHRLYAACADLPDESRRRDVGLYFGSVHATLEHLLKTDHAWTHLLRGGTLADLPAVPVPEDFAALRDARAGHDALFVAWMDEVDEAWLDAPFAFTSALGSWQGLTWADTRGGTLAHLFNHHTHHRGQAHTGLSLLGADPPALDMLVQGMLGK